MPGAVSGPPGLLATRRRLHRAKCYRRMDRQALRAGRSGRRVHRRGRLRQDPACGASLVQLLTALVYEGPGVVRRINAGLAKLLERDGFASVSEAVGVDAL